MITPSPRPRLCPVALLLAGALTALPINATETTPARELLARSLEALGGDGWNNVGTVRLAGTLATAGLSGSLERVEDVARGRYVTRYDLGVAAGAEGWDGDLPWELAPGGELIVKDSAGDLEGARTEAFRVARAAWLPDRGKAIVEGPRREVADGHTFDVLVIRPEGGRAFELWLDAETHLPARTVEDTGTRIVTTVVSDWREVGGLLWPFREESASGQPGSETTVVLATVELDPVLPENAFAPPGTSVPDDVAIAGGADAFAVPFELLNNHVYVMARVGDGPARRFLVDTGGANLLTRAAAEELGIPVEGAFAVQGVGEASEQAGMARLPAFHLGAATLRDALFFVLPFDGIVAAEGVDFAGLVGFEMFQRFAVTLDYPARTMTLVRPEAFTPPAGAIAVPFRMDDRHPVVEGTFAGIPGTFNIDTGSRAGLDLHRPFVEAHDLLERFGTGPAAVTGWGVGGPVRSRLTPPATVTLGSASIDDVPVALTLQEGGAFTDPYLAGNVGGGLLKRFRVTFDYAGKVMYLEPPVEAPREGHDRSGMWLNDEGSVFRVADVVAGGAAERAGIVVGDAVLSVDGVPAAEFSLPELRARFRTVGESAAVAIELRGQDGSTREVTVVPRDPVAP